MPNDLQTLADRLLGLKIAIAPQEKEFEMLKGIFSEATATAGEGLIFSSALGMVETRKGAVKTSKGKIPVLKPDLWPQVPENIRDQLMLLGVIVVEEQFSKESKPAVSIKPSTAAFQAANGPVEKVAA